MESSSSPKPIFKDAATPGDHELHVHVLAVDDSVTDRKLVERLLSNSACKVTTVESGPRALEFLGLDGENKGQDSHNDSKINLIITDYCMPGMSGYELLKIIKESSTMREIPVVVMSSEDIPTRVNKCLEGGAQEFMLKPLRQSDVKRLRCHMKKFSSRCNGTACLGR